MDSIFIPNQQVLPPPCPTCGRPMYHDAEHNPLCAAIQNLEKVMYSGAAGLEKDQAERWAELHEGLTSVRSEVEEKLRVELNNLRERLADLETAVNRPGSEEPPPDQGEPKGKGKPGKTGEPQSAIIKP